VLGSVRTPDLLPAANLDDVERHVRETHQYGFRFNYLLNASCVSNAEHTQEGRRALLGLLDALAEMGVDIVTVSIPYVIELARKRHPRLPIAASVVCNILSVQAAKTLEELGVQRLVLSEDAVRDFPLLKNIRTATRAELAVIANTSCLLNCAYKYYHRNVSSHENCSPLAAPSSSFLYNRVRCTIDALRDPAHFIMAPWIRPEDVNEYLDLGITHIKLAGRGTRSDVLVQLIQRYVHANSFGDFGWIVDRRYTYELVREGAKVGVDEDLPPLRVKIRTEPLNGFIEFFKEKRRPCSLGCGTCTYCRDVARTALIIDDHLRAAYVERLMLLLDQMLEGQSDPLG